MLPIRSRTSSVFLPLVLPVALAVLTLTASAQDTRMVTQPAFPPVCSTLTAQLQETGNALPSSDESSFDTTRIQDALNTCSSGEAVELALDSTSGYNAFLIQPISIPSGVTLLVDAGVTVYGSRNPADYAVSSGSCGIIGSSSKGCNALITIDSNNAGLMGYGVIDGRGGQTMTGGTNAGATWWQLAYQAQQEGGNQNNPTLLNIDGNNITLYKITLQNSPMFHVTYQGSGFTVWDIRIIAPGDARNSDGIDPGPAQNVTITGSYIGDGDDNIALKPGEHSGGGAASDMSILDNHFYVGHGMSIGSQTAGGASNILVQNLDFDGDPTNSNDTGIRIKSESSNGGLVSNVTYEQICMQNVASPIQFNPFYDSTTGTDYPQFQNITLSNVTVLTAGKILLEGYSSTYPLGLTLDNVNFSSISSNDVAAEDANVTLGPGPVNISAYITGTDVNLTNDISDPSESPYTCSASSFPLLAPEFFASGSQLAPGQPITLTAILEPVREPNWESTAGQYSSTSAYYPVEPTGTVTFYDGSSQVGQVALGGNTDIASVTLNSEDAGSHSYTAVYSGDTNYQGLTTAAVSVNVADLPTSTSLTASPTQAAAGSSIDLTATVTSSAGGTPTGTVEFLDGTTEIGTALLNAGVATLTTSILPPGSDSLTAEYQGDTDYAASTSAVQVVSIGTAATTTALTASSASIVVGQSVTFTATVSSNTGTPSGTVTFLDGSAALGTGTLNAGVATFSTSMLAIGGHSVTAAYAASADYAASTSPPLNVTVSAISTTLSLTTSASVINAGQTVTLTATLTSPDGMPAGAITFLDGSTTLGTATVNASGVATYTAASLAAGSHSLTANYAASGSFAASSASPVTVEVQNFTVSASTSSLSIAPGGSASTTLTFTSEGGLAGTINYSCTGLPAWMSCSFSPSSATLSGSTASTVLTISVASTTSAWVLPLLSLLALLPLARVRRRRWLALATAALGVGLSVASLTGCSGGSSSTTGSQPPPAGPQTAVVTATTTTAAGTLSSTAQIAVTVQ